MLQFEWHPVKGKLKHEKHRILFSEAATVFGDPLAWTFPDQEHSTDEERFLTVGLSEQGKLIIVSHTNRGEVIRIISARKATRHERKYYEKRKQ